MTQRGTLKTYSLLGPRAEPPSEYELVTSRLHYYVGRGFEVNVPLRAWYERYQQQSPLQCPDWEVFADPRAITYPRYTQLRKQAELELDRLCASPADRELSTVWVAALSRCMPPLRFAFHGFHMVASYVGHMAPSGRLTLAALFQAADEQRRIERIAQRMCQLRETHAEFGRESRADWQTAAAWQPLREALERLLVTYDWGEAFVGLNLCLKPVLDELVMRCLADACAQQQAATDAALLRKLYEDCVYQREWCAEFARVALAQRGDNRAALERWAALWSPRAYAAADALAQLFDSPSGAAAHVRAFHRGFIAGAGLAPGAEGAP